MASFIIHIDGQVQGVGFRPLAYQLALEMNLKGTISNTSDGVRITVTGPRKNCELYYQTLITSPPENARITWHTLAAIPEQSFSDISIVPGAPSTKHSLLLTPDIALCETCRMELHDPSNRRYGYPFITCLNCGPRYSIIRQLPYDRENTTMDTFQMCSGCNQEYNNPLDKRHYSQTNSCLNCAVEIELAYKNGKKINGTAEVLIQKVIQELHAGKIIAVKGIGGFLVLADPCNETTMQNLRDRKNRPAKPFALLYPSLERIRKDAVLSEKESRLLKSKQSPIVLLTRKETIDSRILLDMVAPNLNKIGVMLPYAPILELIIQEWGEPLIATSGNISNAPIIFENKKALEDLNAVADIIVLNNRDIVVPQDDSVIQLSQENNIKIILRRSRGYAPVYLPNPFDNDGITTLAMGSDLKSSFALLENNNLNVSQYLGDLESYDTQEAFEHTLNHMLQLYKTKPERILVDQHPLYFSGLLGRNRALIYNTEIHTVQHHRAHFAAVLAENDLLHTTESVLGVVWDGTGYGEDGAIWGGEFFMYNNYQMDRIGHLDYFDHFLGDKFSREPRLSALAVARTNADALNIIKEKFTEQEWVLYSKLLQETKNIQTSSLGRLFDGVASILGLCDRSTYEGEAASYLEALASTFLHTVEPWKLNGEFSIPWLVQKIIDDLKQGTAKNEIAWQFHMALVSWITVFAEKHGVKKIAFSGGVFQNGLLVDMIVSTLGKQYHLFFHQQLSPNDECIGFGQLACYQMDTMESEHTLIVSEVEKELYSMV